MRKLNGPVSVKGCKAYAVWFEQGKWRVKFPHGVMVYDTEDEARGVSKEFKGGATISPKQKNDPAEVDAERRVLYAQAGIEIIKGIKELMPGLLRKVNSLTNTMVGVEKIKLPYEVNDAFVDLEASIRHAREGLTEVLKIK